MKITIEPTEKPPEKASGEEVFHNVVIDHPHDHLSFPEVMDLVKGAMVAWGYSPSTVEKYFED